MIALRGEITFGKLGGGGGSRTRVQKSSTANLYMLSVFFFISPHLLRRTGAGQAIP